MINGKIERLTTDVVYSGQPNPAQQFLRSVAVKPAEASVLIQSPRAYFEANGVDIGEKILIDIEKLAFNAPEECVALIANNPFSPRSQINDKTTTRDDTNPEIFAISVVMTAVAAAATLGAAAAVSEVASKVRTRTDDRGIIAFTDMML